MRFSGLLAWEEGCSGGEEVEFSQGDFVCEDFSKVTWVAGVGLIDGKNGYFDVLFRKLKEHNKLFHISIELAT